jgi:hypothetical protein
MKDNYTEIAVILDRSGSMCSSEHEFFSAEDRNAQGKV